MGLSQCRHRPCAASDDIIATNPEGASVSTYEDIVISTVDGGLSIPTPFEIRVPDDPPEHERTTEAKRLYTVC